MKKIIYLGLLFAGLTSSAQVKIGDNPTNLGASSSLELESTNKALVLTRVANTAAITTPVNGMIVYDLSSNCVKAYENGMWSNCLSAGATPATSLIVDCNTSGFVGNIKTGVALSGASFSVKIINNSTANSTLSFAAGDLALSGASAGITIGTPTPASVTLNPGQQVTVVYPLSGTATSQGVITATWTKLLLTCTKELNVCLPDPVNNTSNATITETSTKTLVGTPAGGEWIVSPENSGSVLGNVFTPSSVLIDTDVTVIYKVPASGPCLERISDPVTFIVKQCEEATNTTSNATIAENGTKTLVASPAGGTWSVVSGGGTISGTTYTAPNVSSNTNVTIRYTISNEAPCQNSTADVTFTVVDCGPIVTTGTDLRPIGDTGTYKTKTLSATPSGGTWSIVSGGGSILGNTYTAPDLPTDQVSSVILRYSISTPCSTTADITFKIVDGDVVYDKLYGDGKHDFVYRTYTSPYTGRVYLRQSLGSGYSRPELSAFNPNVQYGQDFNALGSVFQWGRYPDGHEVSHYTSYGQPSQPYKVGDVTGTVNNYSASPYQGYFIINSAASWYSSSFDSLWTNNFFPNQPCPTGFTVPTFDQLTQEADMVSRVPAPVIRQSDGSWANFSGSSVRLLWTSTRTNTATARAWREGTGAYEDATQSRGFNVRCVKQ